MSNDREKHIIHKPSRVLYTGLDFLQPRRTWRSLCIQFAKSRDESKLGRCMAFSGSKIKHKGLVPVP